jgi:flagellum-specific ATP synthase
MADPIADTVRSILDGHIVLARAVAQRARFPAIELTQSVSRLTSAIVTPADQQIIDAAVKAVALYESSRDLIEVGAYSAGTNADLDQAIRLLPHIERFMAQRPEEVESRAIAMRRLQQIMSEARA